MAKIAPNITNSIQTIILAIITMCGFYLVFRQLKSLENKIERYKKDDQKKIHNTDNKDGVTQKQNDEVIPTYVKQQQNKQQENKQENKQQEKQNVWNNDFTQSESDDDSDEENDDDEEIEEIEEDNSETDTEEIYPKQKQDDGYGEAELAQQKEVELVKQRENKELELAKQREYEEIELAKQREYEEYVEYERQMRMQHEQRIIHEQMMMQQMMMQQEMNKNIIFAEQEEEQLIISAKTPVVIEEIVEPQEVQQQVEPVEQVELNDEKHTLESLNKLKIVTIKEICKNKNIPIKGGNKEYLIQKILEQN